MGSWGPGLNRVTHAYRGGKVTVLDRITRDRGAIQLQDHKVEARKLETSRLGNVLATDDLDNVIRTWDATTGRKLGEFAAHTERTLRTGANGQLVAVPIRDRSAWFERRMRDVGDRVGRFVPLHCFGKSFFERTCTCVARAGASAA